MLSFAWASTTQKKQVSHASHNWKSFNYVRYFERVNRENCTEVFIDFPTFIRSYQHKLSNIRTMISKCKVKMSFVDFRSWIRTLILVKSTIRFNFQMKKITEDLVGTKTLCKKSKKRMWKTDYKNLNPNFRISKLTYSS